MWGDRRIAKTQTRQHRSGRTRPRDVRCAPRDPPGRLSKPLRNRHRPYQSKLPGKNIVLTSVGIFHSTTLRTVEDHFVGIESGKKCRKVIPTFGVLGRLRSRAKNPYSRHGCSKARREIYAGPIPIGQRCNEGLTWRHG